LTADEVTAAGLPAVSLGGTILRTETAGVVAPALVLHRLGRLG
jgi:16S rRNA U1498 N3-methylase RsmE